ncbi:MAG: glycoside hydrolase family 88 protein [Lachnospiraceae bacterium]|nr:glycoside hydrolase family 88 protein [Lachnospiraceae bacterium]
MKKCKKLFAFLLAFILMFPANVFASVNGTITSPTKANVDKVISYANQLRNANNPSSSTGGFNWDTEGKSYSWTYYNGFMMDALLDLGGSTNTNFANNFYNANINSDGTIANIQSGKTKSGYLDSCEPMRAVFDLLETSNASKYKSAIQKYYNYLEQQISYSNCGGNFAHKQDNTTTVSSSWQNYPIGLDGLYMAQPFLMECAKAIDAGKLTLKSRNGSTVSSSTIYNAVFNRFNWIYNNMRNSSTGLLDHGYSVSSGRTNGITWSRGEGWYVMALVDVISMMPNGSSKTSLINQLPTLFDGLLRYQDQSTGLWYNVTAYNTSLSGNKLETSGSAMFAYAMVKAYQNGWVTDSKYYDAGVKAFNGIATTKMTGSNGNYSVIDTYKSSGVTTNASGYTTSTYTTNEAKGVGAVIMLAGLLNKASINDGTTNSGNNNNESGSTSGTVTETKEVWKLANSVQAGKKYLIASGNNGSVKIMGHKDWTVLRADASVADGILTSNFNGGSNANGEDYFAWTFDSKTSGKIHNDKTSNGRYIELWGTSSGNNIVGDYGPNINVTTVGNGAYRLSYGSNYLGTNLTAPPVGSPQNVYLYEKTTITVTVPAPDNSDNNTTEPEQPTQPDPEPEPEPDPEPETEIITVTEEVWQLANSIQAGKSYIIASGNNGSVSVIGNNNGTATKINATAGSGRLTLPNGTVESKFLWNFASATSGKISNNGLYIKISSTAQFNTTGETLAISNLGNGKYQISKKTSNGKLYYLNATKTSGATNTATDVYLYEKVTITTQVEVPKR